MPMRLLLALVACSQQVQASRVKTAETLQVDTNAFNTNASLMEASPMCGSTSCESCCSKKSCDTPNITLCIEWTKQNPVEASPMCGNQTCESCCANQACNTAFKILCDASALKEASSGDNTPPCCRNQSCTNMSRCGASLMEVSSGNVTPFGNASLMQVDQGPPKTSNGFILVVLVERQKAVLRMMTQRRTTGTDVEWVERVVAEGSFMERCVSKDGAVNSDLPCKITGDANPPKNQKKGGQSAPRFQRAYLNAKDKWVNYLAEVTMHELLALKEVGNRPAGILVAGFGGSETLLNTQLLDGNLPGNAKVASKAVQITKLDGHDVKEALKKDEGVSAELQQFIVAADPATEVIATFLEKFGEGQATTSKCSVEKVIEWGALETLILCPCNKDACPKRRVDQEVFDQIPADATILNLDTQFNSANAAWCKDNAIGATIKPYLAKQYARKEPWIDGCGGGWGNGADDA